MQGEQSGDQVQLYGDLRGLSTPTSVIRHDISRDGHIIARGLLLLLLLLVICCCGKDVNIAAGLENAGPGMKNVGMAVSASGGTIIEFEG